jgi:hypothetical protein
MGDLKSKINDFKKKNLINNKEIEDNILNLKIISKIREGDKLLTQNDIIEIDKATVLQGVYRWMNSEGRQVTIKKLNDIVEDTIKITDHLFDNEKKKLIKCEELEENNSQLFQKFILEMTNSLLGLENLKKTYNGDITISAQIDILLGKLNIRIEKMSKVFSIKID